MKKKITLLLTVIILMLVTAASVGVGAWYVRQYKTQSIDASTTGIVFSYTIGEDSLENAKTYDVKNVAFFDIDSDSEGMYLKDMACVIEIEYTNRCLADIDITIKVEPNDDVTGAHIEGLVTKNLITSTTGSVNDVIEAEGISNSYTLTGLVPLSEADDDHKSTDSVYLYLYGVQPDDNQDNTFLKDKTYSFTITATAVLND